MKAVKGLLLGGAAGLAAVAGAQAADLPVKAKAVEYVKVCSLYGEGFFYIPGTDTCLKVGGWVRFDQYFVNTGGSGGPFNTGSTGRNDSFDSFDYGTRTRTQVSFDVRTRTEYGTLRAYYRAGFELTTNFVSQGEYYFERAFIEFAGFTFGKIQSYFDFSAHAWSFAAGFAGAGPDTASGGRNVMAYSAEPEKGVLLTIAAEDTTSRRGALWDAGTNSMSLGSFPGPNTWTGVGAQSCAFSSVTSDQNIGNAAVPFSVSGACATGDYATQSIPDIIGSLRIDQSWGTAELNGAVHQVRGNFYGNDTQSTITAGPNQFTGVRPSDAWGWAVLGGVVLNLPWNAGDKFWFEATYGRGTPCYVGFCQDGYNGTYLRFDGRNVAASWALDGVFANVVGPGATGLNGSGILLPTNWDVTAAVEHYWTPALRTSLFGSVTSWDPGAQGNAVMCASPNGPVRTSTGATPDYSTGPVAGCNYAFRVWAVGSRTIWNPVKNLDVGAEVMFTQINQNMDSSRVLFNFSGAGNRPAGLYTPSDEGIVSGMVRVQRNFWP